MRMRDAPSFRTVHDGLLLQCADQLKRIPTPQGRLSYFRNMTNSYLPDAPAFEACFHAEISLASEAQSQEVFEAIYYAWRRRDVVRATLAWSTWLLEKGRGKEASDVVQRARVEAGEQRQELEDGWREVLQSFEEPSEPIEEISDVAMQQDP